MYKNKTNGGKHLRFRVLIVVAMILVPLFGNFSTNVLAASSNNLLQNISFSIGELNYDFSPSRTFYEITIPSNTESIEVTPVLQDKTAKFTVVGHTTIQKESSTGKVVVTVVAANGDKKWYTFSIKFGTPNTTTGTTAMSAGSLSQVEFDIGTLLSPFASTIYEYTLVVPKNTKKIKVTAISKTSDPYLVSGNDPIDLMKASSITIRVKDVVYTFHLVVEGQESTTKPTTTNSDNFGLELLEVKGYKLNKQFQQNVFEYSMKVSDVEEEFQIIAIATVVDAMIEIDQDKSRIKIVVSSDEQRATYVIKLQGIDQKENNQSLQVIFQDLLISLVLLSLAIVLFFLSKKVKHSEPEEE